MIKPTDSPSLRQFGHFIPVCNGVNQVLGATDQIDGSQSNGTGPASRQLQDKTGGVAPAGLLLIARSVAAPEVVSAATVGCRSMPWNRSPISYGGFGKGASPRPILRLRLWPKTVIDRVWPILSASCRPTIKTGTAGVRALVLDNLDAGITRQPHHVSGASAPSPLVRLSVPPLTGTRPTRRTILDHSRIVGEALWRR